MKVLLQWALANPRGWEEHDSRQLEGLSALPLPLIDPRVPGNTHAVPLAPGWVFSVNIQGVVFTAFDHYHFRDLEDGCLQVTVWNDNPSDYTGMEHAYVYTFKPAFQDWQCGGAWNVRQTRVVYATDARRDRMTKGGTVEIANTEFRPWSEFVRPTGQVFHGLPCPESLHDQHVVKQESCGWRNWTEGVPQEEIVHGKIRPQRFHGRWPKAKGTRTYWVTDTTQAIGFIAPSGEYELLCTTTEQTGDDSTPSDASIKKNASEITHAAVSPASEPNSADWPAGSVGTGYRFSIDCGTAGPDVTYGLLSTLSADGGFHRATSDLAASSESVDQSQSAFSGTGINVATNTTWNPSAGNASDRVVFAIAGDNTGGSSESFGIYTLDQDSYGDGPWPSAGNTVVLSGAALSASANSVTVDAPISLSLNTAALALTANVLTVGAVSPVTVPLTTAALTVDAVALSVFPGEATIGLSASALTIAADSLSVAPGEATVSPSTVLLTVTAGPLIVAGAGATISLDTAGLSVAATSLSAVPGAVSALLSTPSLDTTAGSVAVFIRSYIGCSTANLAILANGLTISAGEATIELAAATLAITASVVDASAGESTIGLNTATLTATANGSTTIAERIVSAGQASLSLLPKSVWVITPQTVLLTTVALTLSAETLNAAAGETTTSLSGASLTVVASSLSVLPGEAVIGLNTAALSLVALSSSIGAGESLASLVSVVANIQVGNLTVVPGPTSVSLNSASISVASNSLNMQAGLVAVALSTSALSVAPASANAVLGLFSALTSPAPSVSANSLLVIPGEAQVVMDSAILTLATTMRLLREPKLIRVYSESLDEAEFASETLVPHLREMTGTS